MNGQTKKIYAEQAWLAPGHFARRVLVEFTTHIIAVRELEEHEHPPSDAIPVQWLTPGFVNAHCHLEYTWLQTAGLPRGHVPFGKWMRAIISHHPTDPAHKAHRAEAMHKGAQRLLNGGCTTVIDSTTDGTSAAILQKAGLRHFLFYEVLGLSHQRAEPIWNAAKNWQQDAEKWQRRPAAGNPTQNDITDPILPDSHLIGTGLNPHAPYSVGPWLRDQLNTPEAAETPKAWHLAETPDEEQLFRSASGSIADFLRNAKMPMPWTTSPGDQAAQTSPDPVPIRPSHHKADHGWNSSFDFLRATGQLDHCDLAFHGNQLSAQEARYFTPGRGIVHCPGTHRWFQRPTVPLKHWLNSRVNVCLGTDSLASADTLSMFDVIRMTLEDNPDLTPDDALTMASTNPWRLRFMQTIPASTPAQNGTITTGAIADLLAWNATNPSQPTTEQAWKNALKNAQPSTLKTWINGRSN